MFNLKWSVWSSLTLHKTKGIPSQDVQFLHAAVHIHAGRGKEEERHAGAQGSKFWCLAFLMDSWDCWCGRPSWLVMMLLYRQWKGGMEEMYVLWCTRDPDSFWCHSCFVIRNQKEGWFNLGILEFFGFPQTSSKCMAPFFSRDFPLKKTVPCLSRLGVANQPGGHRQAEWLEYGSQTHRGDEPNMDFSGGKLPGFAGFQWALKRCIWKLGAR